MHRDVECVCVCVCVLTQMSRRRCRCCCCQWTMPQCSLVCCQWSVPVSVPPSPLTHRYTHSLSPVTGMLNVPEGRHCRLSGTHTYPLSHLTYSFCDISAIFWCLLWVLSPVQRLAVKSVSCNHLFSIRRDLNPPSLTQSVSVIGWSQVWRLTLKYEPNALKVKFHSSSFFVAIASSWHPQEDVVNISQRNWASDVLDKDASDMSQQGMCVVLMQLGERHDTRTKCQHCTPQQTARRPIS